MYHTANYIKYDMLNDMLLKSTQLALFGTTLWVIFHGNVSQDNRWFFLFTGMYYLDFIVKNGYFMRVSPMNFLDVTGIEVFSQIISWEYVLGNQLQQDESFEDWQTQKSCIKREDHWQIILPGLAEASQSSAKQ